MGFPWRRGHVFFISIKTDSFGWARKLSGFFQVRRWGGELKGNTQGREESKNLKQEGDTIHSTLPVFQYSPVRMPRAAGEAEAGAVRGSELPTVPTHPPSSWLPGGREALQAAWPGSPESAQEKRAAADGEQTWTEGEMKILGENSLVSWSPRCGAVGAGPALLKSKPGPQGREGRAPRRRRPLAQP